MKKEISLCEAKKESRREKVILIPARLLDIIKELFKDDNKINTSKDYSNSLFNFSQKEITKILENGVSY